MKNIEEILISKRISSWQTALDEVKVENIRLKNLLAKAISKNVSRRFVEEAEIFHQQFLDKDQVVDLLRHDISLLITHNPDTERKNLLLTSLERDIHRLQTEMSALKTSFYQYLQTQPE